MATIDLCNNTICQQRKKVMLYNTPTNRYTPINPYEQTPSFSKFQLDMRRKAEILKYSASASSTKTNNLTKNQKWSQIISGKTGGKSQSYNDIFLKQMDFSGNFTQIVVKYPDTYTTSQVFYGRDINENPLYFTQYTIIKGSVKDCDVDSFPQPTTASGVPGPVMYLVKDNKVPLYNYATQNRSYGITNAVNINPWKTIIENDLKFYDTIITKLFTLVINNTINEYAYNFRFQVPISIFFNSQCISDSPEFVDKHIAISDITIVIKYNNEIIQLQKVPQITSVTNFSSVFFNIPKLKSGEKFNGQFYLGLLTVSNLYLYTQAGYVYDINIICSIDSGTLNNNADFLSYFNNLTTGVIFNISSTNTIQNNCTIQTTASSQKLSGFSFTGS
jgi:hypothetical protein